MFLNVNEVCVNRFDSSNFLYFRPFCRKVSYFTGKTAASDSCRRKSVVSEDRERSGGEAGHDQASERRQQDDANRSTGRSQHDQMDTSISQNGRPVPSDNHANYPNNVSLTTPLCWSKHSALLGALIGANTSNQVARWSCEEVVDFLTKFGMSSSLLDKFKNEVRVCCYLLCLTLLA